MGHSRPLFLYFRLFYKQLTGNIGTIKNANYWIRTAISGVGRDRSAN